MINLKLKNLKEKTFHFIGIGGISMSALAQILKKNGYKIQGSDLSNNDEVLKLRQKGIKIFSEHLASNLQGVSVVVYSSAIHFDNEELVEAKRKGLVLIKRAELLGLISSEYGCVIAIAGSHGKTTATAMISEMFLRAGLKPTIHIGGKDNLIHSNYKIGNKKYFITEACEYMDNYKYISPDISVILNIDSDHLDYFGSQENVIKSFESYAKQTRVGGVVFANKDDVNSENIISYENCSNFGIKEKSDIQAKNIREYLPCRYSFDTYFCGVNLGKIKLNILGKHNIYNALATIMVGLANEIDFDVIKYSLENFMGVERRCQKVRSINGAVVYHDYAHHPKQIEKMVKIASDFCQKSGGKIITVFEPHTYSRTAFLLDDFARSFCGSDFVILAPVYSARESESDGKNSNDLLAQTQKYIQNVECINTYENIYSRLKTLAKKDDFVLILGAGTIENIIKLIK